MEASGLVAWSYNFIRRDSESIGLDGGEGDKQPV
jgi:hypothetical protein